ncbi:biotin--[acetyl-CoA-carboxylase] ligase [Gordonia iterans]
MNDDVLPDPVRLTAALAGTCWTVIDVVAETGSTNADLLGREGAPSDIDGVVLIAGLQTAGRGRHSRVWQTPRGQLAVSAAVAVAPGQAESLGWLSLLAGMAVHKALAEVTGVRVELKWPNDILAPAGVPGEGRKVSGILSEFRPAPGGGGVAVIGTGLNLDLTEAQPPIETAACIRGMTGTAADPTALSAAYLRALSELLVRWPEAVGELADEYRTASATLGRQVRLVLPGDTEVIGTATGIDDQGRIVVEGPSGRVTAAAGDVTHLRLH